MIYAFRIECCLSQSEHNTYTCTGNSAVREKRRPVQRYEHFSIFFCSVDIWFFWVLHKLLYWSTLWNPSCRETQSLWGICSLPPLPRRKAGHSAVRDSLTHYLSSLCLFNSYRARAYTGKLGLHLDDRQDSTLKTYLLVFARGNQKSCMNDWILARSLYVILSQTLKEFHWLHTDKRFKEFSKWSKCFSTANTSLVLDQRSKRSNATVSLIALCALNTLRWYRCLFLPSEFDKF